MQLLTIVSDAMLLRYFLQANLTFMRQSSFEKHIPINILSVIMMASACVDSVASVAKG